jgi:hypothetical protein
MWMSSSSMRSWLFFAGLLSVYTLGARSTWAQSSSQPSRDAKPASAAASETSGKARATLKADLVDPEKKSKAKEATVKVDVTGVEMVDPASVSEKPAPGQAHLHYRVDDGPIVATTAKKLSFHELSSGKHTIKVVLAANDHSPLGPEQTLDVNIP